MRSPLREVIGEIASIREVVGEIAGKGSHQRVERIMRSSGRSADSDVSNDNVCFFQIISLWLFPVLNEVNKG